VTSSWQARSSSALTITWPLLEDLTPFKGKVTETEDTIYKRNKILKNLVAMFKEINNKYFTCPRVVSHDPKKS